LAGVLGLNEAVFGQKGHPEMKRKILVRTVAALGVAGLTCVLGAFALGQANNTNQNATQDQTEAPSTGFTQRLRNIVRANESTAAQGVPTSGFTERLQTIMRHNGNTTSQAAPGSALNHEIPEQSREQFLRRYGLLPARPQPAPGAGTTASAEANKTTPYLVQEHDTLDKLAALFGVSVQAIEDANPGLSLAGLKPGQQVMIPTELPVRATQNTIVREVGGRQVEAAVPGTHVPAEIQAKMRAMVDRIREAKTNTERRSAEQELRDLLNRYFDSDSEHREQELAAIEKRVNKLRNLLASRKEAKDSIVNLQYQVLVNEAEGLGFFGGEPNNPIPHSRNAQSPASAAPFSSIIGAERNGLAGPRRANAGPSGAATPLKWAIGNDLRALMLGVKEYALDHQDSFPDTLENVASHLNGGTNFLNRIVSTDGGEYLIYIRAPGQVGNQHPDRLAILVPASDGCWVARCDGSVMLFRKTAAAILLEECREIGTEQPGTTARVSGSNDLTYPAPGSVIDVMNSPPSDVFRVLKGAGIFATGIQPIAEPKRIRILLTGPNSGSK
jgi:LysM repeat protein